MKDHRIIGKPWFRIGGIALALGAVLLATLLFNLPASAYPPEPTPTPQQGLELHAESGHSAAATQGPPPSSLDGGYWTWGGASTCLGVDQTTAPWSCIGPTNEFHQGDWIHNLAWLFDVTDGGWSDIEFYLPNGDFYDSCQFEIEDPYDYGYDSWSSYSLDCYAEIGSAMCEYPGWWHTEFWMLDYGGYTKRTLKFPLRREACQKGCTAYRGE